MSANNASPFSPAATDAVSAFSYLTAADSQPEYRDLIEHVSASHSVGIPSIKVDALNLALARQMHTDLGLPTEVEDKILDYLTPHDLVMLKRINNHFHCAATAAMAMKSRREEIQLWIAEILVRMSQASRSDADFEEMARQAVLSTVHVGVPLNRIMDPRKQQIVLNVLKDSAHLVSLDIQAPKLNASLPSLLALLPVLNTFHGLRDFRLNLNRVGIDDDMILVLTTVKSTTALQLAETDITASQLTAIAQIESLATMDISGNEIDLAALEVLAEHKNLKSLHANRCGIVGPDLEKLLQSASLERVTLAGNGIEATGVKAIGLSQTLKAVNLSFNTIGDEGAKTLATSKLFETLTLKRCGIGPSGAAALASTKNPRLASIDLRGNTLGAAAVMSLIKNSAFRELHLPSGQLDADTRKVLSDIRRTDPERVIEFARVTT